MTGRVFWAQALSDRKKQKIYGTGNTIRVIMAGGWIFQREVRVENDMRI